MYNNNNVYTKVEFLFEITEVFRIFVKNQLL